MHRIIGATITTVTITVAVVIGSALRTIYDGYAVLVDIIIRALEAGR